MKRSLKPEQDHVRESNPNNAAGTPLEKQVPQSLECRKRRGPDTRQTLQLPTDPDEEQCKEAAPITGTKHGLVSRCVYCKTVMRATSCPYPVFQSHICLLFGKYYMSQTFEGTCAWVFGLTFC